MCPNEVVRKILENRNQKEIFANVTEQKKQNIPESFERELIAN